MQKNTYRQRASRVSHPTVQRHCLDNITLKPKLFLQLQEQLGVVHDADAVIKLQKGILELWNCIHVNTKQKIEMPIFHEDDPLSKALLFIIETFEKVKHKDSSYQISQEDTWFFREWLAVPTQNDNGNCICVGMLEPLYFMNKELHDLLLMIFSYMQQKTHMFFMGYNGHDVFDDYLQETISQHLEDGETAERKEDVDYAKSLRASVESYQSGKVAKYAKLITKGKKVTAYQIRKYVSKNIRKLQDVRKPIVWINDVLTLLEKETYSVQVFDYNAYDPECNDGWPAFYSQTVGWYWHRKDPVFLEHDSMINETVQGQRLMEPTWSKHWYPDRTTGEISNSMWPVEYNKLLTKFNTEINPLIISRYGLDKQKY